MIHQLKLQANFFEEKIKGLKPWELRVNDRGFKVGDYIGENEVIEDNEGLWIETGRFVLEKITNIVDHNDCAGLHVGWVILTCEPCIVSTKSELARDMALGALCGGLRAQPEGEMTVIPVYGGEE